MTEARGNFSSKLGFILAVAGSAVGLGNIWKFPFEVADGGGAAFVFIYLLFCFVLCFPVMVAELAIGRKAQRNPAGAFVAMGFKQWKFAGVLAILCGTFILSFYNVVAGWAFGFFVEISTGNFAIGKGFGDFIKDIPKILMYSAVFMGATAFIVSKGVSGGIEKAAKILMPALLAIILLLLGYAFTLPHALDGVAFYLIPDFSKINIEVIYGALGQAFFSLSLGMGAIITYGSYVGKKDNLLSSATFITLADVGIAFIAGLMMFPLVAYLSEGNMTDVKGGPGLIFVTLPGVFETLGPVLGAIIGGLFFLLLSFAALTSTVSLLEVPVAYVVDEWKISRQKAVWGTALAIFLMGIPSMMANGHSEFFTLFITYFGEDAKPVDFMTFIGHLFSDSFLPLGGFLVAVFVAYAWSSKGLAEEVQQGCPDFATSFYGKYVNFALRYLCPVILGTIFILTVLDIFFGIQLI